MEKAHIRQATEADREQIAAVFVDAFYMHWKQLSTNQEKIAKALKNSLRLEYFIVAERQGEILGFLGYALGQQRAVQLNIKDFQKQFGFFKGYMVVMALRDDFEKNLNLPGSCCYIDQLGVASKHSGRGIATALIQYLFDKEEYAEYRLNVIDTNDRALSLYKKLGFEETSREPVKFAKQRGFSAYIHMQYTK